MKKIMIFLMVLMLVLCFANIEYSTEKSLIDISRELNIPEQKFKEVLQIEKNISNQKTLAELQIDSTKFATGLQKYEETKSTFLRGIVLVGMLIVFISLSLVGFLIGQLQHLHLFERKKVSSKIDEKTYSNNEIAAMVTIYLHEKKVEQQNNLLVTWTRAPVNMWRASNVNDFPNNRYFKESK